MTLMSAGFDRSLKDGRGAIHDSRNPRAGTKPSGLRFMQIVPPVIMIRTRDSAGRRVPWGVSMALDAGGYRHKIK